MKKIEIETKSMILRPMSDGEIEALMECIDSDELRLNYGEMLNGCKNDPANRIWYAPWKMTLKDSGEYVGDFCFKGPVENNSVEIGYGVLPENDSNGYLTEALPAITQWAFGQKDVVFIETETEPTNLDFQSVLEKCGFVSDGTGIKGPHFLIENPLTNWVPTYMLFGIAIGMAMGHLYGQILWGMTLGISLGVLVGMLLNGSEKKKRETVRKQRNSHT